jgi:hypothetical protein
MIAGIEMDVGACFSEDYLTARTKFRDEAAQAGGVLFVYENPNKGPHGEALTVDLAWFGPKDASKVLVLVSATHGVEGFCGSGAQLDWIRIGRAGLDQADTAILLVHALNPHGFAWLRRTTEEGVDLNRNCIPFEKGLPENEGYSALADAFLPRTLDADALQAASAKLDAYRAEHGKLAFDMARSSGQYTHPEGFFYGGTHPTWALQTLYRICDDFHLSDRRSIAIIDYHTGLGSFGYGEPICGHRPGESGQARCRAWYGMSLGEPLRGRSSSVPIAGLTQYAWARKIGEHKLTFVALEFGTFDLESGARALRDDHWLHAYGTVEWASVQTQAIKKALRRFYHPNTTDWKELVLMRSRQVISQALQGLTAV